MERDGVGGMCIEEDRTGFGNIKQGQTRKGAETAG